MLWTRLLLLFTSLSLFAELPLYYWQQKSFVNFGDFLSHKLVERIVGEPVRVYRRDTKNPEKKLLAIGSVFYFASDDDVIWGSGINGKTLRREDYSFKTLDIRAVRGPYSREFIQDHFNIDVPEIYGDPALLFPHFFPEFQRSSQPKYDYIVILHYKDQHLYKKEGNPHIVYATDPWDEIVEKICNSAFVISSAMHGIIIAEAYGIPARLLRLSEAEHFFKFQDYYAGTGRLNFAFATSIEDALEMGGAPPFECDLEKLYQAFPFDFWPNAHFYYPESLCKRSSS